MERAVIDQIEDDLIEFEKLYFSLREFNLMEVLKISSVEIRHSNFLAWLLDPKQNHRFGSWFLERFLKEVDSANGNIEKVLSVNLDLESFYILRENKNIDITILSESEKVVIVIENKIKSSERDGQLLGYKKYTNKIFSNYKQRFVYLTLDGEDASDDTTWKSMSHRTVLSIINELLDTVKLQNEDTRILIEHYAESLRRTLMDEVDVKVESARLYRKHKKALDLIFKYQPNNTEAFSSVIKNCLNNRDSVVMDICSPTIIRFTTKKLDNHLPHKGVDSPFSNKCRVVLFEVTLERDNNCIHIDTVIGPVPDKNDRYREWLIESMTNSVDVELFNKIGPGRENKHYHINKYTPLQIDFIQELSSSYKDEIKRYIDEFMELYIPKFEDFIINLGAKNTD